MKKTMVCAAVTMSLFIYLGPVCAFAQNAPVAGGQRFDNSAMASASAYWTEERLQADDGQQHFSNASLRGKYGWHRLQFSFPTDNTVGAAQMGGASGFYEFHGDGTLSGKDVRMFSRRLVRLEYDGTYEVNPDGTGTLQLNLPDGTIAPGEFVIVDHGKQIEIIFTTTIGFINTFSLFKQ